MNAWLISDLEETGRFRCPSLKGQRADCHHFVIRSSGVPVPDLICFRVRAICPANRQAETSVSSMARRPAAVADTANSRRHSSMAARDSDRAARNWPKRAAGIVRAVAPRSHSLSSWALAVADGHTSLNQVWTISWPTEKNCRPSGSALETMITYPPSRWMSIPEHPASGSNNSYWISRTPRQDPSTGSGDGPRSVGHSASSSSHRATINLRGSLSPWRRHSSRTTGSLQEGSAIRAIPPSTSRSFGGRPSSPQPSWACGPEC